VISNAALWLAQGLGIGRIPWAPGTWGSLLGLGWTAALLASGSLALFWMGVAAGFFISVWAGNIAEARLHTTDPPSVVLDEITAVPLCFAGWIVVLSVQAGHLPGLHDFVQPTAWPLTAAVFLAFRFFDIVKPWPIRQSQALPGGWGITVDDFLAAGYVNLCMGVLWMASGAK